MVLLLSRPLSGCVHYPSLPPYAELPPGPETATITGEVTDPGFWTSMSKIHSYAAQIDGDAVTHDEDPGRTVVLTSGKRFVTLG